MSDVGSWSASIGLDHDADAFETNDIGMDPIGEIGDQALRELGMPTAGHRLRIRAAIAKLNAGPRLPSTQHQMRRHLRPRASKPARLGR